MIMIESLLVNNTAKTLQLRRFFFFRPLDAWLLSLFMAPRRRAVPSCHPIIQRGQSKANRSSRYDSKQASGSLGAGKSPTPASLCGKLLLQQQRLNKATNQRLPPEDSVRAPGFLWQRNTQELQQEEQSSWRHSSCFSSLWESHREHFNTKQREVTADCR